MSYFDFLRAGSKVHKVDVHSEGVIQIRPTEETDECLQQFQDVVGDAQTHCYDEGYTVLLHQTSTRSLPGWAGPVYASAVISAKNVP